MDLRIADVEKAVKMAFRNYKIPTCELCGSIEDVGRVRGDVMLESVVGALTQAKYICKACAFGLGLTILMEAD